MAHVIVSGVSFEMYMFLFEIIMHIIFYFVYMPQKIYYKYLFVKIKHKIFNYAYI